MHSLPGPDCKGSCIDEFGNGLSEGESVTCQVKNIKGCCTCNASGNITKSLNIIPCIDGKK